MSREQVRCRLLGQIACQADPDDVGLSPLAGQAAVVLAHLAVMGPGGATSDQLAFALWQDHPPDTARTGLHVVINRLRKRLGTTSIVSLANGYQLDLAVNDVDISRFERLAEAAGQAEKVGNFDRALIAAGEALDLWFGDPFSGLDEPSDLLLFVEELRDRRAGVEELRVEALLALGDVDRAVIETSKLVRLEPLREQRWRHRMLALYAAGRGADASAAFADFRMLLGEQLGLEPSPQLVKLEIAMLRHEVEVFEPGPKGPVELSHGVERLASAASAVRNDETPFVGRSADLAILNQTIEDGLAAIIVGPPGVGKTRLARECTRRQHRPARTFWLDLCSEAPGRVAARAAEALGAHGSSLDEIGRGVRRLARSGRFTVVFDNCEHVVEEVIPLVQLLAESQDCDVIATSRVSFVSNRGARIDLRPLDGQAALELLENRLPVEVMLELEAKTAIVDRCDRLPLAIELVAPHLSAAQVGDVVAELAHSNRVLRIGREALSDRVASSLALVTERTRSLFESLGPLAATFDTAAAAAISARELGAVHSSLEELVQHCLLSVDYSSPFPAYQMLQTVRRQAVEVAQRGEKYGELRRRHANHYSDCALRYSDQLRTAAEPAAVAGLQAIDSHLWQAWDWCQEQQDSGLAADLVTAVGEWAIYRLRWRQLGWASALIESGMQLGEQRMIDVLGQASRAEWGRGDENAAITFGEAAVERARQGGYQVPITAHFALMSAYGLTGNYSAGHHHLVAAKRQAVERNDGFYLAGVLSTHSMALTLFGLYDDARAVAAEATRVADDTGNQSSLAWALYASAYAQVETRPELALGQLEVSVEQAAAVSNKLIYGLALAAAANCQRRLGRLGSAALLLTQLLDQWEPARVGAQITHIAGESALLIEAAGDAARASALLAEVANEISHPHLSSDATRINALRSERTRHDGQIKPDIAERIRTDLERVA